LGCYVQVTGIGKSAAVGFDSLNSGKLTKNRIGEICCSCLENLQRICTCTAGDLVSCSEVGSGRVVSDEGIVATGAGQDVNTSSERPSLGSGYYVDLYSYISTICLSRPLHLQKTYITELKDDLIFSFLSHSPMRLDR
jgi:hypothetical protein